MEIKESFASRIKEEISQYEFSLEEKRALLASFSKINGHLKFSNGKQLLELSTENSRIAKSLYTFIKDLYGVNVSFAYTKGMNLSKRVKYHVLVNEPDYVLGDLEVDLFDDVIPKNQVANADLFSAYVSGAFLACGSVNDPISSNYHLEFSFLSSSFAKAFVRLLSKYSNGKFNFKLASRRKQTVVYVKKSETIADFLIFLKASNGTLEYENIRVDRDFSNIGNRLSNLDGANMAKTLKASQRQVEEINYFVAKGGFDYFKNPKVKILMKLRLDNPDASLEELRDLLSTEIASSVSKSNINHK